MEKLKWDSIHKSQLRAKQCSHDGLLFEAEDLFEQCIEHLQTEIQSETDAFKHTQLLQCQKNCSQQIKKIKSQIDHHIVRAKRLQYIKIAQNSIGHNYDQLFGEYLNHATKEILLRETYIYKHHQFQNLIRFFELCVTNCPHLHYIRLVTTKGKLPDNAENHSTYLEQIKMDLMKRNIRMTIKFNNSHDRQILLNNDYIINIVIQRGLDIYQKPPIKYSLGLVDYKFRRCKESSVTICKSRTSLNEAKNCSIM